MWEDNLKKIINEKKMYDEEVNLGASKEEIDKLIVEAKEKLGVEIPKEYLDILSKVNGIEFNGFIKFKTSTLYPLASSISFEAPYNSAFGSLTTNEAFSSALEYKSIVGNTNNSQISDILNSKRVKNIQDGFKKNIVVEELCQKCEYRTRFDK